MNRAKKFNDILDECLDRILIKGETIEQCLASYPEQAAELEPLLQTTLTAKDASAIKPRPEFRERARYQFHAALREMEAKRSRRFFGWGWQPRWATVAIAVLIFLVASSGTVFAAGNSMPDEALYPVKLATERVRLALTPSALGKAELYVELVDKRVAEIVYMADKGKPEQIDRTAQRLNTYLVRVASLAAPAQEESEVFMAPAPASVVEESVPAAAPPPAPEPQVVVEERPAPQAPKRVREKAQIPAELTRDDRGGEGEDAEVDRRAKIRVILARKAANHPEALQQALQKAPESVKPALRRAIAESNRGYERALKALD